VSEIVFLVDKVFLFCENIFNDFEEWLFFKLGLDKTFETIGEIEQCLSLIESVVVSKNQHKDNAKALPKGSD